MKVSIKQNETQLLILTLRH